MLRAKDSDATLLSSTRIYPLQQLGDEWHVVLGESYDGWASSAQANTEKVGMLDVKQIFEARYERLSIGLMKAIL